MPLRHFEAERFPSTFGNHAPLLVLSPGDRLVTRSVDAYGFDADGRQLATGDNPLTGPFGVEGAMPGDALILNICRLRPNRDYGYSESPVVANVVEPGRAMDLPPRLQVKWHVDIDAGVARAAGFLDDLDLPAIDLHPVLGSLGVAPDRDQAIWSGTAGRYGGNMDYRGIKEGATIYLPVFVPGACFYLGDGHAAQGAGEIGGTGIEISMDVELTVNLSKQVPIVWPRGEDADFIWTIGNARPLEQAMQHATTEMLRWLQSAFAMTIDTASVLLSQASEYEVGNVCNPAFTMVCKLRKTPFLDVRRSTSRV